MRQYLAQNCGLLLTAVLVSIVTFSWCKSCRDPALLMLGTEATPEAYARLRQELNLDRPALERYLRWFWNFLQGEWGDPGAMPSSQGPGSPVFPLSLVLASLAVGVSLLAAVPAGILMAARPKSWPARFLSALTQVGMGLPQFWTGLLLIQVFAVKLGLLPAGGNASWAGFILPVLTLALPRTAVLSRFMRVGMSDALRQDYIRTAHAKGLSRPVVFSSMPCATVLGRPDGGRTAVCQLLAGTIVVEQVFGLPGVGQLLLAGTLQRDLPLVQTVVMIVVLLILLFDLAFDLLLGLLDPRIRYE